MKKILIIFLSTLSMLLISCPLPNQINDDIETVIDNNDDSQEKEEISDDSNQKEDETLPNDDTNQTDEELSADDSEKENEISNEDVNQIDEKPSINDSENEKIKDDDTNQTENEIVELIETFIVSFDSNGGTFVSLQKIEKGKTIEQPQNPIKDNCEFVGWYLGDSLFDFSTPIISDITLKAKWNKIYFTVTFDSDGGTLITSQEVEKGNNIEYFQNPTKNYYEFVGWYLGDSLFDFSAPITSNITLKAKWNKVYFNVTFDSDGGSQTDTQLIYKNTYVKKPNEPKKDSWYFIGWYLNDVVFNFDNTQITEDITLKAKWKPIFTVTFDSNGGTDIDSQFIKDGDKCILPKSNPTKEGCNFAYWYNEDENVEFDFNSEIDDNITLKAKWYRYSCYVGDYNAIDLEYYVNDVCINKKECGDGISVGVYQYVNNRFVYLLMHIENEYIIVEKGTELGFIIKDVSFDEGCVHIIYE